MSEIKSGVDVLQQVRDALDAGLTTVTKTFMSGLAVEDEANCAEVNRITETKTGDADYIEIDEYCKMLQDCRENESLLFVPMDSRTLIPKYQTKLDSQHTPHSISDLHERISSFDIMKWSQKPDSISSFECSRYGWKLSEWGFLSCVTCKQILHIPPHISTFSNSSWADRLKKSVESTGHLSTCPWTKVPSLPEILSIPQGTSLYTYLCEAVSTFKLMRSFPTVESYYKMILVDLNLKWLAELTSATAPQEDELVDKSASPGMVLDMVLFLILSGWTMSDSDDLIKCKFCLREVPLWLCQSTPAENEILDLLSPPPSPAKKLNKSFSYKELDPVSNHWSWCPWRQRLQRTVSRNKDGSELNLETSSDPENANLRKITERCDYERLLEEFQQECANMSLRYDKEKTGVQLLTSVASFMDNVIASPGGRSRPPTPVDSDVGSGEPEPGTETLRESPTNAREQKLGGQSKIPHTAEVSQTNSETQLNDDQKSDEPPKKRIRREFFDSSVVDL